MHKNTSETIQQIIIAFKAPVVHTPLILFISSCVRARALHGKSFGVMLGFIKFILVKQAQKNESDREGEREKRKECRKLTTC